MKSKKVITNIIGVIVGFSVVIGILRILIPPQIDVLEKQKEIPVTEIPVTKPPINGIRVTVDFGGGKSIFGDVEAKNAEEALRKLADKNGIKVEMKKYSFGNLIIRVGDTENSKTESWIYYVNGHGGDKAANLYEIKNGDRVEWKYEKNAAM